MNSKEGSDFQPGDTISILADYGATNGDPKNSYPCQAQWGLYDANNNFIAGDTVTFTVGAANACGPHNGQRRP